MPAGIVLHRMRLKEEALVKNLVVKAEQAANRNTSRALKKVQAAQAALQETRAESQKTIFNAKKTVKEKLQTMHQRWKEEDIAFALNEKARAKRHRAAPRTGEGESTVATTAAVTDEEEEEDNEKKPKKKTMATTAPDAKKEKKNKKTMATVPIVKKEKATAKKPATKRKAISALVPKKLRTAVFATGSSLGRVVMLDIPLQPLVRPLTTYEAKLCGRQT